MFFLAAEGSSDEIVAEHIIRHVDVNARLTKKTFPARGFQVVRRSIPTVVRAAYFGYYDILIVHFDLNATIPPNYTSVQNSERWQQINNRIHETHNTLRRRVKIT